MAEHAAARLPAGVHRWLLIRLQPWRLWLWGLQRRCVAGVIVLAFAGDGRIVLVRHSYHLPDQWLEPGGGRATGEDARHTATRELAEETGCTLRDAVLVGQVLRQMPQGWTNRIEIVTGTIADMPVADGREIVETGLFAIDALPAGTHAAVHEYLAQWSLWRADPAGAAAQSRRP